MIFLRVLESYAFVTIVYGWYRIIEWVFLQVMHFARRLRKMLQQRPFPLREAEQFSMEIHAFERAKNKTLEGEVVVLWRELTDKIIAVRNAAKNIKQSVNKPQHNPAMPGVGGVVSAMLASRSRAVHPIRIRKSTPARNAQGAVVYSSNPAIPEWLKWAKERGYEVFENERYYEILATS